MMSSVLTGASVASQVVLRATTIALVAFALPDSKAGAAPALLYSQPAYESPVRGDPNDLLLLPGYGLTRKDVVVYSALNDTNAPLTAPADIPQDSNAQRGVAPI